MPPAFHHLTDEYEPTNPNLWEKVLDVARGDAEELTIGNRTIHKPTYRFVWPSPPASAWAVKQYNGFGGNWRKRAAAIKTLYLYDSAVWLGNWNTYAYIEGGFNNLPESPWQHHFKVEVGTAKTLLGGLEAPVHVTVRDTENHWQTVDEFDMEATVEVIPKGASMSLAMTLKTDQGMDGPKHIRGITRAVLAKAVRELSGYRQLRDFQLGTKYRKLAGGIVVPFSATGKSKGLIEGDLEVRVAVGVKGIKTDVVPALRAYLKASQQLLLLAAEDYRQRALAILDRGGVVTSTHELEHVWAAQLGAHQVYASGGNRFWEKAANLADELTRRVERTLAGPLEPGPYAELSKWVAANFRVDSAKTPRGQKRLKEEGDRFLRGLRALSHPGSTLHPAAKDMVEGAWDRIKPRLDDLVQYFTTEGDAARGKREVLTELKLGQATYYNRSNLSNESFKRYAEGVERVFASLKGWRKKALSGNLKVAFVGAQEMRSQGKYKQADDTLLVRATPKVLKRTQGYGTMDYIIVHELGHRYERFHGTGGVDFDKPEWWTTRYSRTESMAGSESFAELFALGHFRLTGDWSPVTIDRFEKVMGGDKESHL
jgi:hypothetical protein